jgi:hypothetical protein
MDLLNIANSLTEWIKFGLVGPVYLRLQLGLPLLNHNGKGPHLNEIVLL